GLAMCALKPTGDTRTGCFKDTHTLLNVPMGSFRSYSVPFRTVCVCVCVCVCVSHEDVWQRNVGVSSLLLVSAVPCRGGPTYDCVTVSSRARILKADVSSWVWGSVCVCVCVCVCVL